MTSDLMSNYGLHPNCFYCTSIVQSILDMKEDKREAAVPGIPSEALQKEFERDIITSPLDLDLYKLTMGQFAWEHYPDVPVTYEFVNRTKDVKLAREIPQKVLEDHFHRIQKLSFTDEDIMYLRNVKVNGVTLFKEAYLQSLKDMQLPKVSVSEDDGQYKIEVHGSWSTAMYWETFILSTVNELYYRKARFDSGLSESQVRTEGRRKLDKKLTTLENYIRQVEAAGGEGPYIMDFGTRRRYAGDWQQEVVSTAAKRLGKYFIGTSNVSLGQKLNIAIKGTLAHETDMVFSGIFRASDDKAGTFVSHDKMLEMWYQEYGKALSVALTDTYGDDFFFEHFTKDQAEKWIGLRQDSGDPIEFGKKAIAYYKKMEIDPKEKTLVFSDGLTVDEIIRIHKEFHGKVKMIFGWGTTLTNDVGFQTMSLIVKATQANGHGTAKLSNNIAKAVGKDEDKSRAIRMANYRSTYNKAPQV